MRVWYTLSAFIESLMTFADISLHSCSWLGISKCFGCGRVLTFLLIMLQILPIIYAHIVLEKYE